MKITNKQILIVIFLIQAVWLAVHMFLNYNDLLNPWKLGGYSMYVEPKRIVTVEIVSKNNNDYIYKGFVHSGGFIKENFDFNFYCKKPSEKSIRRLIKDNPFLIDKDFDLLIHSPVFTEKPGKKLRTRIAISWPSSNEIKYTMNVCDKIFPEKIISISSTY